MNIKKQKIIRILTQIKKNIKKNSEFNFHVNAYLFIFINTLLHFRVRNQINETDSSPNLYNQFNSRMIALKEYSAPHSKWNYLIGDLLL
jgi:hypothetical protein